MSDMGCCLQILKKYSMKKTQDMLRSLKNYWRKVIKPQAMT